MCYSLNLNSPCRVFAPCDRKRWRLCPEQDPPRLRAGFAMGYFSSVNRFWVGPIRSAAEESAVSIHQQRMLQETPLMLLKIKALLHFFI
jgi:hypothetical protein